MKFELLDYEAIVSYNKEQHYPFEVTLFNNKEDTLVSITEHVTIAQLCFEVHREMLYHDWHHLNPMQTLHAIEKMRDALDYYLENLGE